MCLFCVRVFIAYSKQHARPGGARPRESESLVFVPRQAVFSRELYFYLYGLYWLCACVASPQYSSPRFRGHRFPPPLGKHAVVGCALLRFWFSAPLCWGGGLQARHEQKPMLPVVGCGVFCAPTFWLCGRYRFPLFVFFRSSHAPRLSPSHLACRESERASVPGVLQAFFRRSEPSTCESVKTT